VSLADRDRVEGDDSRVVARESGSGESKEGAPEEEEGFARFSWILFTILIKHSAVTSAS
jgi:hypothetical protein